MIGSDPIPSHFFMEKGTDTECHWSLLTFGIPVDVLPRTSEGILKTGNHKKWLEKQKLKERLPNPSTSVMDYRLQQHQQQQPPQRQQPQPQPNNYSINNNQHLVPTIPLPRNMNGGDRLMTESTMKIDLPGRYDVLFGRGKPIRMHSGNTYLQYLLEQHKEEYEGRSARGDKRVIAAKVMDCVKEKGGRFLKKEPDGWWVPVDEEMALDKVLSCFRTLRMKEKELGTVKYSRENAKRSRMGDDALTSDTASTSSSSGCFSMCSRNSEKPFHVTF